MSQEQIAKNPGVDYTRWGRKPCFTLFPDVFLTPSVVANSPDLISLVFSDVGILTPEGVSQYLVGMFAG